MEVSESRTTAPLGYSTYSCPLEIFFFNKKEALLVLAFREEPTEYYQQPITRSPAHGWPPPNGRVEELPRRDFQQTALKRAEEGSTISAA